METQTDLLRVDEVAARLRCSPLTVRRRIREGDIPAVRLGVGPHAPIRVTVDALERFLRPVSPRKGTAP